MQLENNDGVISLPVCRCWLCRQEQGGHATARRLAHTRAEAAADPRRGWPCVCWGEWIAGATAADEPLCEKCMDRRAHPSLPVPGGGPLRGIASPVKPPPPAGESTSSKRTRSGA